MANIRISGGDEIRSLARTLDLSSANTVKKARDIVRKAAFAVERGAKQRAPVDTGALRNSINTTFSGSRLASLSGTGTSADAPIGAEVGPEVHYGRFVEQGTWRMAPQPYLGPAFDFVEPSFIAALENLADQALD